MAVHGNKGQVIMSGGRDKFGASVSNEVWATPDGANWTKLSTPPWNPRAYHAMMRLGGCIYIMGGQKVSFIGNPFFNDVWKSCDDAASWTSLGNAPWETRAGIAFTVFNHKMYVAGGCYHSSIGKGRYFLNDVWSSADGQSWQLETQNASWSARSGARLIVHNGVLLLVGGEVGFTPDTQLGDIWKSADGKTWDLVTQTPGFQPRSGHGVVVVNEVVYVIAGWVNNKCMHDLWKSTDGSQYTMLSNNTWDCSEDSCGKFDFWPVVHDNNKTIITIGGSNAYSTFGKLWADTWTFALG